jgi:uncharacterized membrane protein
MDQDEIDSAYRQRLVEVGHASQMSYDKALLTLSAGAMGLSLNFVKELLNGKPHQLLCVLMISWVCWIVSIASVVLSFYLSVKAHDTAIGRLDEEIRRHREKLPPLPEESKNMADLLTRAMNIISGVFFFVGLIFVIIFVFNNL